MQRLITCDSVVVRSSRKTGRSPSPRGLRRESAAARLLGLWIRILLGIWMSVIL